MSCDIFTDLACTVTAFQKTFLTPLARKIGFLLRRNIYLLKAVYILFLLNFIN